MDPLAYNSPASIPPVISPALPRSPAREQAHVQARVVNIPSLKWGLCSPSSSKETGFDGGAALEIR
jgi:hypothetical protein